MALLPETGLLIDTVGGVFGTVTVMFTEALVLRPPESVTLAVMVWVPALRVTERLAPVPNAPLMLEVQAILLLRLPSCVSDALPESVTRLVVRELEPLTGLLIEIVGAVFGAVTVIVTEAAEVNPLESVALAVIVWVPAVRAAVKLAPVPIWPVKLDVQTSFELRLPSWGSFALPVNWMEPVVRKVDPLLGAVILTVGAVVAAATATVKEALALAPAESVTVAVMI